MKKIISKYQKEIKFTLSSIFSSVIDLGLFRIIMCITFIDDNLLITSATIISRCVSSIVNFFINKKWSFASKGRTSKEAIEFFFLFIFKMGLSSFLVTILTSKINIDIIFTKAFVDIVLFFFAYYVQNTIIFK